MKRALSSSLIAACVPPLAFFAVTAHPARLYAETAPAPSACTAPSVTACADAAATSACSYDGGAGFCQSALCSNADSGFNESTLECRPFASNCAASQVEDCEGKSAGNPCGTGGHCAPIDCSTPDGGSESTLVCVYTGAEIPPEAGPKGDASATDGSTNDAAQNDAGNGGTTTPPASGDDDDGCSCRTAGTSPNEVGSAIGFIVAALAFVGRRRPRR